MVLVNKQAAAKLMQVSIRTLERYTKQGKITPVFAPGEPRPTFNEDELTVLKAVIEAARPSRPQFVESGAPSCVTFKIAPYHWVQLANRAAQFGMSAGQYARHIVIESLASA